MQILSLQSGVWIGLNDKSREGTWVWVNGEKAVVPAAVLWTTGQPNDSGEGQDCGDIVPGNEYAYGTNDLACSTALVGLCEKSYTL